MEVVSLSQRMRSDSATASPGASGTDQRPRGRCPEMSGDRTMRDNPGVSAMDDYLDDLPPRERVALEPVRAVVGGLVPDAEEGTSYGVPAFIYAGRPLLGFSATKNHLSIFPFSTRGDRRRQAATGRL